MAKSHPKPKTKSSFPPRVPPAPPKPAAMPGVGKAKTKSAKRGR
jgi:hypothetical protein